MRESSGAFELCSTRSACASVRITLRRSMRSASGNASSSASRWLWKTFPPAAAGASSAAISAAIRLEDQAEAEAELIGRAPFEAVYAAVVELQDDVGDGLVLNARNVDAAWLGPIA